MPFPLWSPSLSQLPFIFICFASMQNINDKSLKKERFYCCQDGVCAELRLVVSTLTLSRLNLLQVYGRPNRVVAVERGLSVGGGSAVVIKGVVCSKKK